MKYSIKKQFAMIFIGLMSATILLCWFINSTFLGEYYMDNKMNALKNAYTVVNRAFSAGNVMTEEFDIQLQKMIETDNISLIVLDADSKMLITSRNDQEIMSKRLWENFFSSFEDEIDNIILEEEENYTIQRFMDSRTMTEYIEIWGVFDNGNIFLFRTALEGIRDSVAIANRLLAYIGIAAVVISGIIIVSVSRKVTEPILELTEISERMARLDFDAKYCGNSKTEIALLGNNINELSNTLETTISELKTANNELQKDIEYKNEIDEMRKEFLANVSHELKTPIALIQGYAEGLKEGINDDAESREFYCDVIIDEAAKMNNMVKKLLTLNQLEFGNDVISMERFDIVALIQNYIQSAEILTKQKDIKVRFENIRPPVYVWADEFKTEEVFGNYFSNAINHVSGDKIIDVKLIPMDGKVRVSVFNTGEPVPEDSIPHLWEKFYKVDKARTREYGGSGVGLSIVKAIMESMNQNYGVANYDNGVAFWFELEAN
ncbi:MAG TPA: two-component sensor histidine kinase [Lachnospiraceae bacterium]|nr:two-component sensor histidine kinase [Lachnospiraceae bacterium]